MCVDPGASSTSGSEGGESGTTSPTGTDSGIGSSGAGPDGPGGVTTGDVGAYCADVWLDADFCVYSMSEVFLMDGQCCAKLSGTEHCCDGRPFFVHGEARTADTVARADWARARVPDVDALAPHERQALAEAWRQDALMEHASIASFARFALQLLAVGAPPDLVEDAQRAMADEIEHARVCFGLASAYAGRAIGPGALCVANALDGDTDLVAAAVSTVREGCVGETIASLQAAVAARRATDPRVRVALLRIADDEARHAALAWRFVAWAIAEGGEEVRRAVAEAFDQDGPAPGRGNPPIAEEAWHAHGRLTPREQAEVGMRSRHTIIGPLAAALLRSRRDRRADIGLRLSEGADELRPLPEEESRVRSA